MLKSSNTAVFSTTHSKNHETTIMTGGINNNINGSTAADGFNITSSSSVAIGSGSVFAAGVTAGGTTGSALDVRHPYIGGHDKKCVSFCNLLGSGGGRGYKKVKRRSGSYSNKAGNNDRNNSTMTDSALAKELTQLSMSERNLALSDLHGVSDLIDENPIMLITMYKQLDEEISKIKKQRVGYDRAVFLNPRYVQSRDFQIKFLRADRFDPKAAAQRIVNHFELKLKLFGYDKLARDITFEDLSDQGKSDILTGGVWVLPNGYDQAGRKIIMVQLEHVHLDSDNVECLWYWFMNAVEDVKVQKYGIVDILFCFRDSTSRPFNVDAVLRTKEVYTSLPFRFAGIHVCTDSKQNGLPGVMNIFQMAIGLRYRIRFRAHFGSAMEMKYDLLSYGIPTQLLPIDGDGQLDMDAFTKCIEERKQVEIQRAKERQHHQQQLQKMLMEMEFLESATSGSPSPQPPQPPTVSTSPAPSSTGSVTTDNINTAPGAVVDHPTKYDVLLGRGRPYQEFPGNINLAQLIEARQDDYEYGTRYEKAVFVLDVLQEVREMNGKFLRRKEIYGVREGEEEEKDEPMEGQYSNNNGKTSNNSNNNNVVVDVIWEEVDEETAKEKVSNTFRTRKKMEKRKAEKKNKRKDI